ncbi:hypothetical protein BJF85_10960 [Saccharomonospora sp. CUA-673]|nr:hypothetical protein BJF85_10960 [Saccharomonospora sp. CUA-673]
MRARGVHARADERVLVDAVDVDVEPGTVVAVVGRSGSGKTTLAQALLGESRPGIALSGSVTLSGVDLLGRSEKTRRTARAGRIALVPQHPGEALNPMRRIGGALREAAALRESGSRGPGRAGREAAVRSVVAAVGLDPAVLRRFPHQLSGGQQQRVVLAQALITRPEVIVLDEPTTGADTVTRSEIADLLSDVVAAGTALVLLTHDLALARRLAGTVLVLHDGRVVERGTSASVLGAPASEQGRTLVAAESATAGRAPQSRPGPPVLVAEGVGHRARDGAVLLGGAHLTVHEGGWVAIVGRSGAGKTTLARGLAGLTPFTSGVLRLDGEPVSPSARRRTRAQRRHVQYVPQDAQASFDPGRAVTTQIARTAELLRGVPVREARAEAAELLAAWGVDAEQARRRPDELSGGQLQRAALVRALLARPRVLICDEVTSALDTVNRAEVLRTLAHARGTFGMAVVLISHDLAAVSRPADELHVVDAGRIVETAGPGVLESAPCSRAGKELVIATRSLHDAVASPKRQHGDVDC